MCPARYRAGHFGDASVGVGFAAAGPNECEGLLVLVLKEVRVDRTIEARIVQLDREVVATSPDRLDQAAPISARPTKAR